MALYVVVHHPRDGQSWSNQWARGDDRLLGAITTTRQIGELCAEARARGQRVFVHRCANGPHAPTVCCSVAVAQVDEISRSESLVRFEEPTPLDAPPPCRPMKGQNFYMADPP